MACMSVRSFHTYAGTSLLNVKNNSYQLIVSFDWPELARGGALRDAGAGGRRRCFGCHSLRSCSSNGIGGCVGLSAYARSVQQPAGAVCNAAADVGGHFAAGPPPPPLPITIRLRPILTTPENINKAPPRPANNICSCF